MDLSTFLPDFGSASLTLIAFIVAISIIVAVHEYGHYIVGRWSGIHAEVFSLGFGRVLWSRVDRHGTRWQIAALPFGGYVKFMGDADAASGKDGEVMSGLSDAERRRTMHGAPLWARAATVAAGPMFNFIMSVLVFAGFFWINGIATDDPVVGEVKDLPGIADALQPGDRILAVAGQETPDLARFLEVVRDLPPATSTEYRVARSGAEQVVQGPYPFPPLVDSVQPISAAADAGVQPGDYIRAINGQPVMAFGDMPAMVEATGGKPAVLTVEREGAQIDLNIIPQRRDLPLPEGGFETRWLLGLNGGLVFVPATRSAGPFEGIQLGVQQLGAVVSTSLSGLWHMVTGGISHCNLQGPVGIARASGAAASMGGESFIWFIAMLSAAVGLMNLFPIPVLDGGHLVFHAYEAVTGKPPSDGAMRVLMTVGLSLLLGLMVFGLGNDLIFC
ncbi:RIP metalloprotease RseP [Gemmobacter denitrificans]|uniref:Zinc metalloprotease n=1 Tax=Gemmobacter denitrificans TaxID=3123040 RepID=A0ABU8BPM5_9RHOB